MMLYVQEPCLDLGGHTPDSEIESQLQLFKLVRQLMDYAQVAQILDATFALHFQMKVHYYQSILSILASFVLSPFKFDLHTLQQKLNFHVAKLYGT